MLKKCAKQLIHLEHADEGMELPNQYYIHLYLYSSYKLFCFYQVLILLLLTDIFIVLTNVQKPQENFFCIPSDHNFPSPNRPAVRLNLIKPHFIVLVLLDYFTFTACKNSSKVVICLITKLGS